MADWTRPSEKVLKRNLLLFVGYNEGRGRKLRRRRKRKKKESTPISEKGIKGGR